MINQNVVNLQEYYGLEFSQAEIAEVEKISTIEEAIENCNLNKSNYTKLKLVTKRLEMLCIENIDSMNNSAVIEKCRRLVSGYTNADNLLSKRFIEVYCIELADEVNCIKDGILLQKDYFYPEFHNAIIDKMNQFDINDVNSVAEVQEIYVLAKANRLPEMAQLAMARLNDLSETTGDLSIIEQAELLYDEYKAKSSGRSRVLNRLVTNLYKAGAFH